MKTFLIVLGILAIIIGFLIWCCIRVSAKSDADMYEKLEPQTKTESVYKSDADMYKKLGPQTKSECAYKGGEML